CTIASYALNVTSFTCANLGANTVTLSVTDEKGNVGSNTATVTIQDTVVPVVNTQNIIVQLDGTGNVTITPAQIDNVSTDNCGIASYSLDNTTFSCEDIGENTVTLTVTDVTGNSNSTTAIVTVEDNIAPIVATRNITVQLDAGGLATIVPGDVNSSGGLQGLYALYPWDGELNVSLYNYDSVTDEILLDEGFNETLPSYNNFGFDYNTQNGLVYYLGADESQSSTRYLYSYNTDTGIVTLIEQMISDGGNTKPQDLTFGGDGTLYIVFQSGEINAYDISTQTISAFSTVSQDGSVGLTYDNDSNRLLYVTSSDPIELYAIDISTSIVTSLFTFDTPDNSGCSAQGIEYVGNGKVIASSTFGCDIIYTVDLETEVTNLLLNPTGSFTDIKDLMFINSGSGGTSDNCGIASYSLDIDEFTCEDVNASSSGSVIRVGDKEGNYYDLNINTGAASLIGTINGACNEGTAGVNAMAFDPISGRAFAQSPNGCYEFFEFNPETGAMIASFETEDVPAALEFVDGILYGSGIISGALVTINMDTAEMTLVGLQDPFGDSGLWMNGLAYEAGSSTMYGVRGGGGITELYTIDLQTGEAAMVGPCGVSLGSINFGADGKLYAGGGQTPARGNIYEIDIQTGIATLVGPTGIMGEGPVVVNAMMTYGSISGVTVTLTVTDVNGNSTSETAIVTVEDNVAPVVNTQNITIQLDAEGEVSITPEMIDNVSTDNCEIDSYKIDVTNFTCEDIGENEVTLKVTDIYGNSSTATATVTVEDTVAPNVVTVAPFTLQLDAEGSTLSIDVEDIENGSTDACGIESYALDVDSFDCSNVGENTVTLSVTDIHGNTGTATTVVTIEDNVAPVVITQNVTVALNSRGEAFI
ncbi:MAG: hypothetical protein GQ540_12290, partial [Lutibacter sp.]|nr:hypothetical protein [Lutibacter sp.]